MRKDEIKATIAAAPGVRPKAILVGPHPTRRGGIASVIQMYLTAWDFEQVEMRFLPTVRDIPWFLQPGYYLAAMVRFAGWLVWWRPDVVHIHFSWRGSFVRKAWLALLARLMRVRVVLHGHASRFDDFYAHRGRLGQALIRWGLNSADTIIVVSEPARLFFQQLNLRPPITLIPNAILNPPNAHWQVGAPPVVLTLGRLEQRKGVYDTLKAVPHILAVHPTTQFWLGGDGDLAEIKRLCAAAPWGEQVRLLGWVRDTAKDEVLRRATLFLLPSYAEGLPMAVLEAMSYGLPIVATPVGGLPTVVIDDVTGFCVPVADPHALAARVNELLADPALCARLGANARQLALARYEIGPQLQQVYALYRDLLKPAGAVA